MSKINNNYSTKLRLVQIKKAYSMMVLKTEDDILLVNHLLKLIYLKE